MPARVGRYWHSLTAKIITTVVVLIAVPLLIFDILYKADAERNSLILRTIQEEGRLISEALLPHLADFSPEIVDMLGTILPRLGYGGSSIKVFFRPAGTSDPKSFFFVASYPELSASELEFEQMRINESDLLARISDSCDYRETFSIDVMNTLEQSEVMTHLGTRVAANGCWAVLTSLDSSLVLSFSPGTSYWEVRELRIASAIYLLMVLLVVSLIAAAWVNLRKFSRVAQRIRRRGARNITFRDQNRIPELDGVASEFDRFVNEQRRSERLIRQAAEENAHALKGPLAVLSQSIEPVRKGLPMDDLAAQNGLRQIEQSIGRLDALISAARRIDEATAELLNYERTEIKLDALLPVLVTGYQNFAESKGIRLKVNVEKGLKITGNDNLLETAMENVIENALDYAPPDTTVLISAVAENGSAKVLIDDDGPGVRDEDCERIFVRHYSTRQADGMNGNFGVGLWIVRRNIEVMGGKAVAYNRGSGGLRVELTLPVDAH